MLMVSEFMMAILREYRAPTMGMDKVDTCPSMEMQGRGSSKCSLAARDFHLYKWVCKAASMRFGNGPNELPQRYTGIRHLFVNGIVVGTVATCQRYLEYGLRRPMIQEEKRWWRSSEV